MAKEMSPEAAAAAQERADLKEEKKKFKQEQKAQRKEAKRRAAEIAKHEEDLGEDGGNGLVTFLATLLIVVLWLAIAGVIIKMDIGGFGSSVLTPILKDVPVLNLILPKSSSLGGTDVSGDNYGGYTSLEEAVDYIRQLELELERVQTASNGKDTELDSLKAEVIRLQEFEKQWVEFQRIKNEFYEEVVYSEKGPGLEAFIEWFETMDPTTAESIYRQVAIQKQEDSLFQEYAKTFSTMKPKTAAAVLEEMVTSNNTELAVRVLNALSVDERADIINALSAETAARLLRMMDPSS